MKRIFFTAANLIDGVNPPKPNTTVVVEDDRITAVGTDGKVPKPVANDTVFDLGGKSLMPGMIECHFHAGYINIDSTMDTQYSPAFLALAAGQERGLVVALGFYRCGGSGFTAQRRCRLEGGYSPRSDPGAAHGGMRA